MPSLRFKDYLKKQMKSYLVVVVLGTTIIFILLTFATLQFHTHSKIKKDNQAVCEFLKRSYYDITKAIDEVDSYDQENLDEHKEEVISRMYDLRSKSKIKFNFTVMTKNHEILMTNLYLNNVKSLQENDEIKKVLNRFEYLNLSAIAEVPIGNYSHTQQSGITLIFKTDNYFYIIEPLYESLIELEHQLSSNLIITDKYHNVLFDNSMRYKDSLGKAKVKETETMIYDRPLKLVNILNVKERVITPIIVFYTVTAVSITLLMLLRLLNPLIKKIVKELDEPLNELLTAIEINMNGNLDYYIESHHFEEFDKIYREFNDLMRNTKDLMIKNEELSNTKREMEIKHLKNQFNPHFIYNTLESIRYETIFNQQTASDMLLSLGRLMQYSIQNADTLVSVKEDFEYVEDYLKLQKMRFKDRLNYKITLEERLKHKKIPKLLIQPIIENSIKHNMDDVYALNISIEGKINNNNRIVFDIYDDGVGIESQELVKIIKHLESSQSNQQNLGIHNVNRTIKLMYGNDFGLTLENLEGLHVRVILPLKEDNHD